MSIRTEMILRLHPEEPLTPEATPSVEEEEDSAFKVEIKQEETVNPEDVARRR